MRKAFSYLLILAAGLALRGGPAGAAGPQAGGVAAGGAGLAFDLDLDVRKTVLDNGLTVLVVPQPGHPRVSCRLVYGVGSVNERPGITGISHLLEHMLFKGTQKIGTTDPARDAELIPAIDDARAAWLTALAMGDETAAGESRKKYDDLILEHRKNVVKDELWRMYQAAGGTGLNAFTSWDVTAYIVNLPANRLELFFWLESDRMRNAVMREFQSEREVVKEERRLRTVNTPTGLFHEHLLAMAYAAHPYRWPVVGWMSDLDALTRQNLLDYLETYYHPGNAVLCLVGGVDPEAAVEMARRYFGPIPAGPTPPPVATVEPPQEHRRVLHWTGRAAPQTSIYWHIPAAGHADLPALEVLAGLLDGETGRLSERLVRQLRIAVRASAEAGRQKYPALFDVSAVAADGVEPEELLAAVEQEIRRLREELVEPAELDRVRRQTVARTLRGLRSLNSLATGLAVAELRGGYEEIEEAPRAVLAVTAEDVRRVARTYLKPEAATVGLLSREAEEGDDR